MRNEWDMIRTFTGYTYEQAKTFQRYNASRYRMAGAVVAAVGAVSVVSMIYASFKLPSRGSATLIHFLPAILLMVSLVSIFFVFLNAGFYTVKQHEKSMEGVVGGQTMLFGERGFLVAFTPSELTGGLIPYDNLEAVHETDKAFYLYVNKQQALIVVKDGIENAAPEELRELFMTALPEKYKRGGKRERKAV